MQFSSTQVLNLVMFRVKTGVSRVRIRVRVGSGLGLGSGLELGYIAWIRACIIAILLDDPDHLDKKKCKPKKNQ